MTDALADKPAYSVQKCLKIIGTKPGYYVEAPGGFEVMLVDTPQRKQLLTKREFQDRFVTCAPAGLDKIQAIFDSMPPYHKWAGESSNFFKDINVTNMPYKKPSL